MVNHNRRAVVARLAAVAFVLCACFVTTPVLADPVPYSNNSEDITVQIACAPASAFPIAVTMNYDKGTQSAVYTRNTTPCPADATEPLSFDGALLPGISGFGNVVSANVLGVVVLRDGPSVSADVDGDGILDVTIRIYYYRCCCYLEIRWTAAF